MPTRLHGLTLPLECRSIETVAASVDPLRVSARHQSLHHFVAKAQRSDDEMLRRVRTWVMPTLGLERNGCWIVDATGFLKKGKHSVGVARRYCGPLGNQDNGQVAVSVFVGRFSGQPTGKLAAVSARGLGRALEAPSG